MCCWCVANVLLMCDVAVQQAQGLSESERATRAWAFVPADPQYPTRLRAARLSWLIWGVIGTQTVGVFFFVL